MKPTPEEIHAGHSIYTPHILALYDFGVLMLSNSFYGDAQQKDCFTILTRMLLQTTLILALAQDF